MPSERNKVSSWNVEDVNVVFGFAFEFERSLRPERLTHIRPDVQLSGTWMLTDVKGAASHLRVVISASLVYENVTDASGEKTHTPLPRNVIHSPRKCCRMVHTLSTLVWPGGLNDRRRRS